MALLLPTNRMIHFMKNYLLVLIAITIASCATPKPPMPNSNSNTKIEEVFSKDGSNAVETKVFDSQDPKTKYKVFYPAQLSEKAPLITWGNGTGLTPDSYEKILRHLASWGFIVIDNYDKNTANGASILGSAKFMIQENNKPGSIFYHKVDVDHIAASGHSQGAAAIINAHTEYADGNLIKTLLPIALPGLIKSNPNKIWVPVFFISGGDDRFFSNPKLNVDAYSKVRSDVPSAIAIRKSVSHDAIRDTNLETGYVTAWMMYQLRGDGTAARVFRGSSAEILSNPNWTNAATSNFR